MSGRVFLCFDCFEDFFLANSEDVPCPYCESSNIREYTAAEVLDLWRKAAEAEEIRYWTVVAGLLNESKDLDPKIAEEVSNNMDKLE